jgi:hypothetical protein
MPIQPIVRHQCRHIFAAGRRCASPSLRGEDLCYFHQQSRATPEALKNHPESFTLPQIEDQASIQLALNQVIARIADMTLNNRRAGLLLYALQIAGQNLPKPKKDAIEPEPIEETTLASDGSHLAPIAAYEAPGPKPLDRTGRGRSFEDILMEYWDTKDPIPEEPAVIPTLQASDQTALRGPRSLRDSQQRRAVLPLVGTIFFSTNGRTTRSPTPHEVVPARHQGALALKITPRYSRSRAPEPHPRAYLPAHSSCSTSESQQYKPQASQ